VSSESGLQQAPLGVVGGQPERRAVGLVRLGVAVESSQHLRPSRVKQVEAAQRLGDAVEVGEGALRLPELGHGHGAIEPRHRRRVSSDEQVVEGHDLEPVGLGP
jgi:hypothetical protein